MARNSSLADGAPLTEPPLRFNPCYASAASTTSLCQASTAVPRTFRLPINKSATPLVMAEAVQGFRFAASALFRCSDGMRATLTSISKSSSVTGTNLPVQRGFKPSQRLRKEPRSMRCVTAQNSVGIDRINESFETLMRCFAILHTQAHSDIPCHWPRQNGHQIELTLLGQHRFLHGATSLSPM